MIGIFGIGWIQKNKFGGVLKSSINEYSDRKTLHSMFREIDILAEPIKNFGRFNEISRNVCFSAALALYDAGIDRSKNGKQNMGILSIDEEGCLQANLSYFKDYVTCGRKLARGSMFVYTLPSTPIAETAIVFGCQGPVMYMTFKEKHIALILEQADMMISQEEASEFLIVKSDSNGSICFVVKSINPSFDKNYLSFEDVKNVTAKTLTISEIISQLSEKMVI